MIRSTALSALLALASCASCSKTEVPAPSATPVGRTPDAAPLAKAAMHPADDATTKRFAKASNAFAFDLYARRRAAPGNLAFSPASISIAMAMAWAGAKGETADEMKKVLHFEGESDEGAAAAGALAARLGDRSQKATLRVANRLFGEKSFRFEPPYLELTRTSFGAPLEPLDFAKAPGPSRERINDWVSKETEGRVVGLVPERGVSPETRLVLVNAIYFLGAWQSPFEKFQTSPTPFFVGGSAPKPVPTMRQTGTFEYAERGGVRALEMPYEGGDLALTVLLPDARDGLAALEASLTAGAFASWAGSLSERRVAVSLPKFKIEPASSLALGGDLKALGMALPFDERRADFGGIGTPPDPAKRLYVGEVFHKALVKVDEAGTEAAAATAVSMPEGGAPPPAAQAVEFRADHPFLFALRDRKTGLILFVGRVVDPAAA